MTYLLFDDAVSSSNLIPKGRKITSWVKACSSKGWEEDLSFFKGKGKNWHKFNFPCPNRKAKFKLATDSYSEAY